VDEELITQLGLLFNQMRFIRRAAEAIERNTAAYRGVTFAAALSAGEAFGQPPMLEGALKVYITNINDLVAPSPGGLLEGLLGGIGRMVGGLFGGLVGGSIGGIFSMFNTAAFARIVEGVSNILNRLGIGSGGESSSGGSSLTTILPRIIEVVDALKEMFRTGASPVEAIAGRDLPVLPILQSASRIVDGLIILIPLAIGALASLVIRINDIKVAVLSLMQFGLRAFFLLRGAVIVTLFDTLAAAARLAARLLPRVGTLAGEIIRSVFTLLRTVFNAALEILGLVSGGIRQAVNALMGWIRTGLTPALILLGDTRLIRVIATVLNISGSLPAPSTAGSGASRSISAFPNLGEAILSAERRDAINQAMGRAEGGINRDVKAIVTAGESAMRSISKEMSSAATTGEETFRSGLATHLGEVRSHAGALAEALTPEPSSSSTSTGLEQIAQAYENWVTSSGFTTLMGRITGYFASTPTVGPAAASSIPGQIVQSTAEQPRATVEIGELVIEVTPPTAASAPEAPRASLLDHHAVDGDAMDEYWLSIEDRGGLAPA
jgi:hypothetical protein